MNPRSNYNNIFCGELQFNIFNDYRSIGTYKDTAPAKIETKIISIIADLEIISEKIKEDRIESERRKIIREKEEQEARVIENKRNAEKRDFKSLFTMAERLHKTNILRQYISTYEEFVNARGEMDEEIVAKIVWAKEKADWLDPFISKNDTYMDHFDKDTIIQQECPKKNSWDYSGDTSSSKDSFWSNPFRKRNQW